MGCGEPIVYGSMSFFQAVSLGLMGQGCPQTPLSGLHPEDTPAPHSNPDEDLKIVLHWMVIESLSVGVSAGTICLKLLHCYFVCVDIMPRLLKSASKTVKLKAMVKKWTIKKLWECSDTTQTKGYMLADIRSSVCFYYIHVTAEQDKAGLFVSPIFTKNASTIRLNIDWAGAVIREVWKRLSMLWSPNWTFILVSAGETDTVHTIHCCQAFNMQRSDHTALISADLTGQLVSFK